MNAMLLSTTHIEQNKKVEWISNAIATTELFIHLFRMLF